MKHCVATFALIALLCPALLPAATTTSKALLYAVEL